MTAHFSLLWILLGLATGWVGVAAAAARRELTALEAGEGPNDDYALIALLRRLRDEPAELALRLRWSRAVATAGVPAALAAALSAPGAVRLLVALLGSFLLALVEASGAGAPLRRWYGWRGGFGYALWSRLTEPAVRISRALVGRRASRVEESEELGLVLAETRAAMNPASGQLGREERRFLRRLLASTTILAADIMTPWDTVHGLDADLDLSGAAQAFHAHGRSRMPVLENGKLAGLLTVRDHLAALHRSGPAGSRVRDHMRSLYFVRLEQTGQELLEELQAARMHLAVVLDRLGRPVGIVTMEDLLEEIVGEIHDERERRRR